MNKSLRTAEANGCVVQGMESKVMSFFIATCDQKFNWAATDTQSYACQSCGLSCKKKVSISSDGDDRVDIMLKQSTFQSGPGAPSIASCFCFLFDPSEGRMYHDILHAKMRTAESYLYYLKKHAKRFKKTRSNPVNGFNQVKQKLNSFGIDTYRAGFQREDKDGRHLGGNEATVVLQNAISLGQFDHSTKDPYEGLLGLFTFTVGQYYDALCSNDEGHILKAQKLMYKAYDKAQSNGSFYIHQFALHGRREWRELRKLGLSLSQIKLQGTEGRNQRDGQRNDNNGGGKRSLLSTTEKQEDVHFDVLMSGVFEFEHKVPVTPIKKWSPKTSTNDAQHPKFLSWYSSIDWQTVQFQDDLTEE